MSSSSTSASASDDRRFGRLLVELHYASPDEVERALAEQARLLAGGRRVRLGQLLLAAGRVTADQVLRTLALQGKTLLDCPACRQSFNVIDYYLNPRPLCPRCGAGLAMPKAPEGGAAATVDAAGTVKLPAIRAPLPGRPRVESDSGVPVDATETVKVLTAGRPPSAVSGGTCDTPVVAPPPSTHPALEPPPAAPAGEAAEPPAGTPFGRYRLQESVGGGGMGVVWRAWDQELRRFVALKQIKHEEAGGPEALQRFLREARLAAKLRHPNIVAVHDVGAVDGRHYITMDFVAGRPLATLLDQSRKSKLAGTRAGLEALMGEVALVAAVADAVAYAHAEGIVHRDLKPANILVDRQGRPCVMDFGLAKEVAAEGGAAGGGTTLHPTMSGEAVGTPAYMSPEQAAGEPARIGPRCDVWALGVILYEVLCGSLPFDGRNAWETLSSVVKDEPVRPCRRSAYAPAELEAVCLKALEKDPGRRYATAAEFGAELRRWLAGEPVLARRPRAALRAWRWLRRHAAAVAGSALASVLMAAAIIWIWHAVAHRPVRGRPTLDQLAAAVNAFEDDVMRRAMTPEERMARAREPFDLLNQVIAEDPNFGPAFSWVARLEELLGDDERARENYDHGCTLSPRYAVVWYLRGTHGMFRYLRSRDAAGTTVRETRDRSSHKQWPAGASDWRARAAADLDRMAQTARNDRSLSETDLRLGAALAALAAGGQQPAEAALARVAGLAQPAARRVRAVLLRRLGRTGEARSELDAALREWPQDPTALLLHGYARQAAALAVGGGFDADPAPGLRAAIADFDAAQKSAPRMGEVYDARCTALICLDLCETARGREPGDCLQRADADFNRLFTLHAYGPWIRTRRGMVLLKFAEAEAARGLDPAPIFRRAGADFDEALHSGGEDDDTQRGRAIADFGWRNVLAALADLQRLPLDPRPDLDAYLGLAEAWQRLGSTGVDPRTSFSAARSYLDRAIERAPRNPLPLCRRGCASVDLGVGKEDARLDGRADFRQALADFDTALKLEGDLAAAYEGRGDAWRGLGAAGEAHGGNAAAEDYARAEADYHAALDRHAPTAWFGLGLLQRSMGRLAEALASFAAGAEAVPARSGWAYARIGETRQFMDAAAKDCRLQFDLAACSMRFGDYAAAAARYTAGLDLVQESLSGLTADEKERRLANRDLRNRVAEAHYRLARVAALLSAGKSAPAAAPVPVDDDTRRAHRDEAFNHLRIALDFDLADPERARTEPDLAPIRDAPQFQALWKADH